MSTPTVTETRRHGGKQASPDRKRSPKQVYKIARQACGLLLGLTFPESAADAHEIIVKLDGLAAAAEVAREEVAF